MRILQATVEGRWSRFVVLDAFEVVHFLVSVADYVFL